MGMTDPYDRADYAYKDSGGWTVDNSLDSGGATNHRPQSLVLGASSVVHFFVRTSPSLKWSYLNNDDPDVLSGITNAITNVYSAFTATRGIYYDDGGVERITVVAKDSAGNKFDRSVEIDGLSVGSEEEASDSVPLSIRDGDTGSLVVHDLAVLNKTVHLLFSQNSDRDLYRDSNDDSAGWGTDAEVLDGVTVDKISCNIYIRDGNYRLAYFYDDAGTYKYNEVDLGVADVGPDFLPLFGVKQRTMLRM